LDENHACLRRIESTEILFQSKTGQFRDRARASLASLSAFVATLPTDTGASQNLLKDLLSIAAPMIEARIAAAEGRSRDDVELLRKAVAAEDRIAYDEPENWFVPTRHALGAALLRSGAQALLERLKPRTERTSYKIDGRPLRVPRQALKQCN